MWAPNANGERNEFSEPGNFPGRVIEKSRETLWRVGRRRLGYPEENTWLFSSRKNQVSTSANTRSPRRSKNEPWPRLARTGGIAGRLCFCTAAPTQLAMQMPPLAPRVSANRKNTHPEYSTLTLRLPKPFLVLLHYTHRGILVRQTNTMQRKTATWRENDSFHK